jgi:hypothetical protein
MEERGQRAPAIAQCAAAQMVRGALHLTQSGLPRVTSRPAEFTEHHPVGWEQASGATATPAAASMSAGLRTNP